MAERAPITWSFMDPDEEYEYEHDWADQLLVNGVDVGDSIIPLTDPDETKHPTMVITDGTITLGAIVMAGTKIQYWFSGGVKGKVKMTATVHTVQGRTYQQSFILPIKEN